MRKLRKATPSLIRLAVAICLLVSHATYAVAASSCEAIFQSDSSRSAFAQLEEYNRAHPRECFRHQVRVNDVGNGYVRIGLIERSEDAAFLQLLFRAIREGSVTELNTGAIDGPKVLGLLVGLRKIANPSERTRVFGSVQIGVLLSRQIKEVNTGQGPNKDNLKAYQWNALNIKSFENALAILRVREAATQFFPKVPNEEAGTLNFQFDISRPDLIEWSAQPTANP